MSKSAKPARPSARSPRQEWPLVVYVWIASLGLLGYMVAHIGLDALPHPVH